MSLCLKAGTLPNNCFLSGKISSKIHVKAYELHVY